MTATWATTADVLAKTSRAVAQDKVDQAEGHIEAVTGVIAADSAGLVNKRDLYWLKAATCYQAPWVADNPDLYTRLDVSSIQQDGAGAVFKPDALVISPLARRCLKKLSWRGTRTLTTSSQSTRVRDMSVEEQDNSEPWQPL